MMVDTTYVAAKKISWWQIMGHFFKAILVVDDGTSNWLFVHGTARLQLTPLHAHRLGIDMSDCPTLPTIRVFSVLPSQGKCRSRK